MYISYTPKLYSIIIVWLLSLYITSSMIINSGVTLSAINKTPSFLLNVKILSIRYIHSVLLDSNDSSHGGHIGVPNKRV